MTVCDLPPLSWSCITSTGSSIDDLTPLLSNNLQRVTWCYYLEPVYITSFHLPAAFRVPHIWLGGCLEDAPATKSSTTSPSLRKRKAENSVTDASSHISKACKLGTAQLQTPSTPISEHCSPSPADMDSEDEIMSGSQSADELDLDEGTQDSELGSIAGT